MSDFYDPKIELPQCKIPLQRLGTNKEKTQYNASAMSNVRQRGDRGVIISVNPNTYTYEVNTDLGGGSTVDLKGVGRITQSPNDKSLLALGTQVAITWDYGYPLICGVLPFTVGQELNDHSLYLTGERNVGGADPLYAGESDANFRPALAQRDGCAGDEIISGSMGNSIGVLEGGASILSGGPQAQVSAHVVEDLVKISCRNFCHETDFGRSEIKNDNGRITWSIRGGSDHGTESTPSEENWTIRMDAGAEGNLFRFALTQPGGNTLFELHVNADGKLSLQCHDGMHVFNGNNHHEKILGKRTVEIKKTEAHTVKQSQTVTVEQDRTTSIKKSDTLTIGTDLTENIMRHQTETIGGKHEEKVVGGNVALMKPGDVARETTINGSWDINIGDPVSGANPVALPSYHLKTFTGDITQEVTVKGDITRDTLLGNIKDATKKGDVGMETLSGNAKLATLTGTTDIEGMKVNLGKTSADEPFVCGNLWKTIMGELITEIAAIIVPTPVGPSAIPQNAPKLLALKARIDAGEQLSTFIKGKKVPI